MAETVTLATPLPEALYRAAAPDPVKAPRWVIQNGELAHQLGLGSNWFDAPTSLPALAGNGPFPGQSPVALAYAGHQFGNFAPQLGDGRAHLIATLETPSGAVELQLKGSGPTPFSRNGDGRAALGPMLREYIVSEAMAGLGIPTTRTLAVVATGEEVYRQRREPGAIVARIAKSHVRVGTFQYLAARQQTDHIRTLVDHELSRSFPDAPTGDTRVLWLLQNAITRQARLIAQWMSVGFIHGVMNTDNMAISGETIDYGPCAFMDVFHPQKVFSSIDQWGRYAWDQQPAIGLWNLTRFAECLLPLLQADQDTAIEIAKDALSHFYPTFERAFEQRMMAKLGATDVREDDGTFIAEMLRHMMDAKADFTLFFRNLTAERDVGDAMAAWLPHWQARVPTPDKGLMAASNPIYTARNHQVEAASKEAEAGHLTRVETLSALLKTPFTEQPNMALFEAPPLPEEEVKATFCGT